MTMRKRIGQVLALASVATVLPAAMRDAVAQSPDVVLECGGPDAPPVSIIIPGTKGGVAIAAGKPADSYAVTDREYVLAFKPMGDVCYVDEAYVLPEGTNLQSRPLKFWTTTISTRFDWAYTMTAGWNGLQLCGYGEIVIDRYTGNVKVYGPVKQYRNPGVDIKQVRGWRGQSGVPPDVENGSMDYGRGGSGGRGNTDATPNVSGQCQPARRRL